MIRIYLLFVFMQYQKSIFSKITAITSLLFLLTQAIIVPTISAETGTIISHTETTTTTALPDSGGGASSPQIPKQTLKTESVATLTVMEDKDEKKEETTETHEKTETAE